MIEFDFDPTKTDILDKLRTMPIFDAMVTSELLAVLETAKLRKFMSGDIIIKEGDTDDTVYFLVYGSCNISVDDVGMATLTQAGELFGEMGMVDHAPRSATVTATASTLCLVLDGDFLERMKGVDALAAKAMFYRIFSENLAARLRAANRRVMRLEGELEELSVQRPQE